MPEGTDDPIFQMEISAQISIYPLRQEHLAPAIRQLQEILEARGLAFETGRMSTQVSGDADRVFDALKEAFLRAAASGHVVMAVTVSNSCPQ
ncbi:MAG TPA: YkoF family thiamine/hydroxymethylpyrimidine-binding protein [Candidatus Dormibacteraeota bacterium]|nr:YkoF family thiamine/hydroxymethylpyrimidine-binding protein [Candidatus Dormibacteraeota bacterium]